FNGWPQARRRRTLRGPTTWTPPRLADYWVVALSLAAQARSSSNEKALIGGGGRQTAPGNWTTPHLFAQETPAGVERGRHRVDVPRAFLYPTLEGLRLLKFFGIFWELRLSCVRSAQQAMPSPPTPLGVYALTRTSDVRFRGKADIREVNQHLSGGRTLDSPRPRPSSQA